MSDGHDLKRCGGANDCGTCKAAVRRRFSKFPIQVSYDDESPHPPSVPWRIAELAYPVYSAHGGRGQSLERLAERGGFGWDEFACFFAGHHPGRCQGTRGGGDRTKCRISALAAVERDAVARERRRIALLIQDAASSVGDDRGPVLGGVRDALLAIREKVLALEDTPEDGA